MSQEIAEQLAALGDQREDPIVWMDDVSELIAAMRQMGKGTAITVLARPKPSNRFVAEEAEELRGVFDRDGKRGTCWIAWSDDLSQDSRFYNLTEFPCEGYQYANAKLRPPMRREERVRQREEEEPPRATKTPRREPAATATVPPTAPPPAPALASVPPSTTIPTDQMALLAFFQAMLTQSQQQLAEQQRSTATAVVEQMQSRAGRLVVTIVDGIRVPAAIDRPYTALYPHLWLKPDRPLSPGEITAWRTEFSDLIAHESVSFKSPVLRDRFELARDTLLTLAAGHAAPSTKQDYRVWCWHIFTIIECVVTGSSTASAGERIRKDLYSTWHGDARFDFEAAIRTKEEANATQETTQAPAAIQQIQQQLATMTQSLQRLQPAKQTEQHHHNNRRFFRGRN